MALANWYAGGMTQKLTEAIGKPVGERIIDHVAAIEDTISQAYQRGAVVGSAEMQAWAALAQAHAAAVHALIAAHDLASQALPSVILD